MITTVTGMTPTEARTLRGWNRLFINFSWQHLSCEDLEGGAALDDLLECRVVGYKNGPPSEGGPSRNVRSYKATPGRLRRCLRRSRRMAASFFRFRCALGFS